MLSETTNGQTIYYWRGLDTIAQSDGTDVSYFEYDGLGSVRQVVDDAGEGGLSQTFDPYGNPYASAGSASTRLGYTGEHTDSNGFVFLRARYYNPAAGRFIQTDPSRKEKNPFLYAAGNPIMLVDLSGFFSCDKRPGNAGLTECYRKILREYEGLEALKQLYTSDEIKYWFPLTNGLNARHRTWWILDEGRTTSGRPIPYPIQEAPISAVGVRDEYFEEGPTQLGSHFLQGVRLGFDNWGDLGIRYAIGHEVFPKSVQIFQYTGVTDEDVSLFKEAMVLDMIGAPIGRNEKLLKIWELHGLGCDPDSGEATDINTGKLIEGDRGSIQDMRLWVAGIRFGKGMFEGWAIQDGHMISVDEREEAAEWLQILLGA